MKPIVRRTLTIVAAIPAAFFGRQVRGQEPGSLLFGQHQEQGVDRFGLKRPPATFAGITLNADQASRVRALDREFGEFFVAQNHRVRQAGGDIRDSVNRQAIEVAHARLLSNIRQILTPEQTIVFDRNQAARNAYLSQRKALASKKSAP